MATTKFPPPPVQTPFADPKTTSGISDAWVKWFQAISVKLSVLPTPITGSKGGNAALTSLLSTLASNGEVTDQTT